MILALKYIKIHTKLADGGNSTKNRKGFNAIYLWFLLRALDTEGSGRFDAKPEDLAIFLQCSVATIKRYVKQGCRLGFFRVCKTFENGCLRFLYTSAVKVGLSLGISDPGVAIEIPLEGLRKQCKRLLTQAQAQYLQKASYRQAKAQFENEPVATSKTILGNDNSSHSRGFDRSKVVKTKRERKRMPVIHENKRFIFVPHDFRYHGVSQEMIAKSLGRHPKTIMRRLSNKDRVKVGLEPLERKQVVIQEPILELPEAKRHNQDKHFRIMCTFGGPLHEVTFRYHTNIYRDQLEILANTQLKSKFKQAFKKLKTQNIDKR